MEGREMGVGSVYSGRVAASFDSWQADPRAAAAGRGIGPPGEDRLTLKESMAVAMLVAQYRARGQAEPLLRRLREAHTPQPTRD